MSVEYGNKFILECVLAHLHDHVRNYWDTIPIVEQGEFSAENEKAPMFALLCHLEEYYAECCSTKSEKRKKTDSGAAEIEPPSELMRTTTAP